MNGLALQYLGGAVVAALAVWGLVTLAGAIRYLTMSSEERVALVSRGSNSPPDGSCGLVEAAGPGPGLPPSPDEFERLQREAREDRRRTMRLHLAEHFIASDGRAGQPELRYLRVKDALELADELLEQNQARPIKETDPCR